MADGPDLATLIEAHRIAEAAYVDYSWNIMTPANDAWRAAVAKIPHVRTERSFANWEGVRIHLTTADPAAVHVSRKSLKDFPDKFPHIDEDFYMTRVELIDAADKRDMEEARLRTIHHIEAINEDIERLENARDRAMHAVVAYVPATTAEWLAKIKFLSDQDLRDDVEVGWQLVDEIGRLVGDRA